MAIVRLALLIACAATWLSAGSAQALPINGIQNIQHVIMIMQENRSFDSYFGTYPGANGIPGGVCVPDPEKGGCVRPFHNSEDRNFGGPHSSNSAISDTNGGRMDGFIATNERGVACTGLEPVCRPCRTAESEGGPGCKDVMGYHDAREIPNYWSYAQNFVLQDSMFAASASWSLPEHLSTVSGWSASCPEGDTNPMHCTSTINPPHQGANLTRVTNAWTDITYLLAKANVSWRYYVFEGTEPDCASDEVATCKPVVQSAVTPGIWNPLPSFTTVKQNGQLGNIQSLNSFYSAVHETGSCGLPNVAWINPKEIVSEHPPSKVSRGQAYVTTLVNAIMRSPCWSSSAIFVSWDEWGGFYDHVVPPTVDEGGYGLRVPGLLISPYARAGFIDHQQLSHDAYLKFIEDAFLGGARLNPATDGRPDPRPSVREEAPGLGDLAKEFDFGQAPRPPRLLPTRPEPGPPSNPPGGNPPVVQTEAATALTQAAATLNATVNPSEGSVGDCHFDYGTSTAYGKSAPCAQAPGSGSAPVAVSAALTGLQANASYYFRIVATNPGGTSTGAAQSFTVPGEALPSLGRCKSLAGTPAAHTGRFLDAACIMPSGGASGEYEWAPGAARTSFTSAGGTSLLETLNGTKISCQQAAGMGEYSSDGITTMTIAFSECRDRSNLPCQSQGAGGGEVRFGPLTGRLGFIRNQVVEGKQLLWAGIALRPSAGQYLSLFECSGLEGVSMSVAVEGSVIGVATPMSRMSPRITLRYSAWGGRQKPARFNEGGASVLLSSIAGGAAEQSGLSWMNTLTNQEPLEIKALP